MSNNLFKFWSKLELYLMALDRCVWISISRSRRTSISKTLIELQWKISLLNKRNNCSELTTNETDFKFGGPELRQNYFSAIAVPIDVSVKKIVKILSNFGSQRCLSYFWLCLQPTIEQSFSAIKHIKYHKWE